MRAAALIVGASLTLAPLSVGATTLDEAIAAARAYNPQLRAAQARVGAADARLDAAKGARLPTVSLTGEYTSGRNDLGGFFGFEAADVDPRAVRLELSQPLFSGGALSAGVDQARAGRQAAEARLALADDELQVAVARAYAGVGSAQELLRASDANLAAFDAWARQAELRFKAGEIPRSDLELAAARRADARAGLARAQSSLEIARAQYAALVGAEPADLVATPDDGSLLTIEEAQARAESANPALRAAEAGVRAAQARARIAAAQAAPSLALTARTEQVRDQFFPGYRSDAVSLGVQGRWVLFAGGRVQAAKSEAAAEVRAAEAERDAVRAALTSAVVAAWSDLRASRLAASAARDQAQAAASAVESLRNEVRVGQRPLTDLLDAQRDQLAAVARSLTADGEVTVAARRLATLAKASPQ